MSERIKQLAIQNGRARNVPLPFDIYEYEKYKRLQAQGTNATPDHHSNHNNNHNIIGEDLGIGMVGAGTSVNGSIPSSPSGRHRRGSLGGSDFDQSENRCVTHPLDSIYP